MLSPLLLILTFVLTLSKGAILPVTFDDNCSNVQCPIERSFCPPDSVERKVTLDVLYGPDEYEPPPELYGEVIEPIDKVEHEFDEVPLQLEVLTTAVSTSTAATTIITISTNSTSTPPENLEAVEMHKKNESMRKKRELSFDTKNVDEANDHARLLHICCNDVPAEPFLHRRRRRRRIRSSDSNVEDCECKPCDAILQCPNNEVAIKTQEATGIPGDCCPSWACIMKRTCNDSDYQPYWRDACTRCSCYGSKGPELCHNECPVQDDEDTQHTCFAADTLQSMEDGSVWYENNYCTKCHCEAGVRNCVESLCKAATCRNPVKVSGQCCPQCPPESDENILIAQESSTISNTTVSNSIEHALQTTTVETTLNSLLENSTAKTSTTLKGSSSTERKDTFTTETSTESYIYQNQSSSMEPTTELSNSSTATFEELSSTTETASSSSAMDDIASEGYFGRVDNSSTEDNTTASKDVLEKSSDSTSEFSQIIDFSSEKSNEVEFTESISSKRIAKQHFGPDPITTPTFVSTNEQTLLFESSTEEQTSSTETIKSISISSSSTSAGSTAVSLESTSSFETLQDSSSTSNTTESTTFMSSKTIPFVHMGSTTTTTSSTKTKSTTIIESDLTNSTLTHAPSISSTYTSAAKSLPSTTTTSPFVSTSLPSSPKQTTSTIIYWYTFSTSAPSPPLPQPTVYQPSVGQFFTRPEIRYVGYMLFVAFIVLCALAIWKFGMPSRSTRLKLKNRYRTVPSSEATSLSHSPTTSHSSMA